MINAAKNQETSQEILLLTKLEALLPGISSGASEVETVHAFAKILAEHKDEMEDMLLELLCEESLVRYFGVTNQPIKDEEIEAALESWDEIYVDDIVDMDESEEDSEVEEDFEDIIQDPRVEELLLQLQQVEVEDQERILEIEKKISAICEELQPETTAINKALAEILGSIDESTLTQLIVSTLASYESTMAVEWLLHMLYCMRPKQASKGFIEMLRIAIIPCIDQEAVPMKTLTKLAVTGGYHNSVEARIAAVKIVQSLSAVEIITATAMAQFAAQVIGEILRNCDYTISNEDSAVIDELLFGAAKLIPMETDALCSKYGPKLSDDIKAKIKLWRQGRLHLCSSTIRRDVANMNGLLEQGFLHAWIGSDDCGHAEHNHHEKEMANS
ncbi:MAG: hypothetical protein JSS50_02035 [Proteobacteria bacterium]|nr:hypothetical protein [Pseudomonadota bacterium]